MSSKNKFVVSVGDEGAIVVYMQGKLMRKRMFFSSPQAQEFRDLLASDAKATVYVLVDTIDQTYQVENFPPVSSVQAAKLVDRKIEKDFDAGDINVAMKLERGKNKEWRYLFISVKNADPLSGWVDACTEAKNPLGGVYLFPVESLKYIRDLKKIVLFEDGQKESDWQILITHNRVGGFRQVVYRNNEIVFTRISQPVGEPSAEVIAGNIEQETLNTIEYLRRLGFADEEGLDIYIIASSDVKAVLEATSVPANALFVLSPFEIARAFDMQSAAEERDKFGDVIAAMHFALRRRNILPVSTQKTRKIDAAVKVGLYAKAAAILIGVALLGMAAKSGLATMDMRSKIKQAREQVSSHKSTLAKVKEEKNQFDKDTEFVRAASMLHSRLKKSSYLPLEVIKKYSGLSGFNTYVNNVQVALREHYEKADDVSASFNVQFFVSEGAGLDKALDDMQLFRADITSLFEGYDVNVEGIPSSISDEDVRQERTAFPLSVKVSSDARVFAGDNKNGGKK